MSIRGGWGLVAALNSLVTEGLVEASFVQRLDKPCKNCDYKRADVIGYGRS